MSENTLLPNRAGDAERRLLVLGARLRTVEEERDRAREQRDALVENISHWRDYAFIGDEGLWVTAVEQMDAALSRIRAEGPEPGPTWEDLAQALEDVRTLLNSPEVRMEARFPMEFQADAVFRRVDDLLSRMKRTVGG